MSTDSDDANVDGTEDGIVAPEDVESQVFDWGVLKWLCTPEVTGAENLSAGVVRLEPGKGHDLHEHPDSEEILYVVSGTGEQTIAGDTAEIGPGETVYIPAGVEHGTINTGWNTLELLAVYTPPGPEDVLGDLPECTIVPAGEIPTRE
jgi:oxalate decarboxylase/phosphoglucose isomerase-like protein (cupin superfamily)